MKQEVQLTSKALTVDDLKNTDHVGLLISGFGKHYIVSIDVNKFTCICVDAGDINTDTACNVHCEDIKKTLVKKVKDVLESCDVNNIYRFDTRKELYQWLAED